MDDCRLILGDSLDVLPTLEPGSVDSIVTDPPAGIAFMGKAWDKFDGEARADGQGARDAYRAENRSRDGYGFSSEAINSKGRGRFIDFLTTALAECLRIAKPGARLLCWAIPRTSHWTGMAIEDAGWIIEDRISHLFGTGFPKAKSKLKPACEDWWLARKPGAKVLPLPGLDACRIGTDAGWSYPNGRGGKGCFGQPGLSQNLDAPMKATAGRWPANLVLDEEAGRMLDEQSGASKSRASERDTRPTNANGNCCGLKDYAKQHRSGVHFGDTGGASRFFYCAKASRRERGDGNTHPTLKPIALMRWLCRLITPPGGTILDPFAGSATTAVAALQEGFGFVGIEREPDYFAIAEKRIAAAREEMTV